MALSASTSQALIQTVRDTSIKLLKATEQYMLVNNPGKLAELQTAIDAQQAALTAVEV